MRLEAFVTAHRAEIINRCTVKVASRRERRSGDVELERAIPRFLDQLVDTLHLELSKNPDKGGYATQHGRDLMNDGFTVAQVVHAYGDVCQSVTDLAVERSAPISSEDFRTLNRCLDDAIADAVTEFSRVHDGSITDASNVRIGILAHEVRNLLSSAVLSFGVLKSGSVGVNGSTGAVLERSLTRLTSLVDRTLAEVRIEGGSVERERVELPRFLEEIEIAASLTANAKGINLAVVLPTEAGLAVEVDPHVLSAIVVNLVQNAIKFTPDGGHVQVSASAIGDRIHVDVADECGGLPPGAVETMFLPFAQHGKDRSGLGLGLLVARRGAEAHGGTITVRDVPGTGCVFTLELPRVA